MGVDFHYCILNIRPAYSGRKSDLAFPYMEDLRYLSLFYSLWVIANAKGIKLNTNLSQGFN